MTDLPARSCACGHPAAAHTAPAGPCALCEPEDAQHRYEPIGPRVIVVDADALGLEPGATYTVRVGRPR